MSRRVCPTVHGRKVYHNWTAATTARAPHWSAPLAHRWRLGTTPQLLAIILPQISSRHLGRLPPLASD
eukprot:218772-Karenia_brevis.AAC.1